MFRKRRHIHAKPNEWIHVHRDRTPKTGAGNDVAQIIGLSIGAIIVSMLVWELIKWLFALFLAALPFLVAAAVLSLIGFAVLKHKLKF